MFPDQLQPLLLTQLLTLSIFSSAMGSVDCTNNPVDDDDHDHCSVDRIEDKNKYVTGGSKPDCHLAAERIESEIAIGSRVTPADLEAWSIEFPWIDQLIETLVDSGALTVRQAEDYLTLKPLFEASELRLLASDTCRLQRSIFYYLLCLDRVLGEEEERVITDEERRGIAYVRSRALAAACRRLWKTPGYEDQGIIIITFLTN
jgi:hypothetical protein